MWRQWLLFWAAGALAASAGAAEVELTLESVSSSFARPAEFQYSFALCNRTQAPWIVFPAHVQLEFEGLDSASARFEALPNPAINPWPSAIALQEDECRDFEFAGLRVGEGHWVLEPGRYRVWLQLTMDPVSGTQAITRADVLPDHLMEGFGWADLWQGQTASEEKIVEFRAQP